MVSLFYTVVCECQHHIKDSSLTKVSGALLTQKYGTDTDVIKSDRDKEKQGGRASVPKLEVY